jgi:hypothetical protein
MTQYYSTLAVLFITIQETSFLSLDPCAERIVAAIKNDQVCVCAGEEHAFPSDSQDRDTAQD